MNSIRPAPERVPINHLPEQGIMSHVVFAEYLQQFLFVNRVRKVCRVIVIRAAVVPQHPHRV